MDLLTELHTQTILVVSAPQAAAEHMSLLAAELALRGPLTVLDGGNRFAPYQVTRHLRLRTAAISAASKHLFVRRAFTCYQMLALLENTPPLDQPYLVLDLLATFNDEQVRIIEALRLLDRCLMRITQLCQRAPVMISLAPAPHAERAALVERVCAQATQVVMLESAQPIAMQPALF